MAYTTAYVFASDGFGNHHLAGTLEAAPGMGTFKYSAEWLQAEWAYPLDPVNLPLSAKRFRALNTHGLFGVFRDAAPDDWGTRIMLLRNQHAPANELERLLRTSGGGVGQLRFSLSRSRALTPPPLPSAASIKKLAQIAQRVDQKQQLEPEELALLEPGSSMGGARPKVTVLEEGRPWLVKFSKSTDLVDVPLLEYASMQFLRQRLGIQTPRTKLIKLGSKHAFAIERFDHVDAGPQHFISANSLFNQEKIRLIKDSRLNPYSYCNLARIMQKHCADFSNDCAELFRRMVANIVMGNTDDHARNHALLLDIQQQHWQLSPAYDMLPTIGNRGGQAMGVGKEGAASTLVNALSYAQIFGLNAEQAKTIVDQTAEAYQQWPDFCEQAGIKPGDLQLIKAQAH